MPQTNIDKILLDNILDDEMKLLFLPFNTMHWMFLLPKYRVYKNFLIFNSRKVNFISFFSVLFAVVCYMIRTLVFPTLQSNVTYDILVTFDGVIFCFGYSISFVLNLYYRKLNLALLLNVQSIFKAYKFNQHMDTFIAVSWFWFAAVVLLQASIILVFLKYFKVIPCDILLIYFVMHFDLNIIYASRFVSLIGSQLNLWISELERISTVALAEKINDDQNSKDKDEDVSSFRMPANSNCIQDNTRQKEWLTLLQNYKKIFETYEMYKKTFQILILYGGAKSFLNIIFFVQYSIEMSFDAPDTSIMFYNIAICLFALKSLVILFLISTSSQRFYATVERVKCACLNVTQNVEDFRDNGARQTCKNILRLNKVAFERMQACRVYVVDAAMPLRFISLVLNYVAVIIQIALGRK